MILYLSFAQILLRIVPNKCLEGPRMYKDAYELKKLVSKVLMAANATQANAKVVAEHLVSANLSGVDTHGVWQLPGYISAIQAGELVPAAQPEILQETATSALVTGNWTFGQVAAKFAMEKAIAKVAKYDLALVGIVESHHIGRLGEYAEMAASKKMISMISAGGFSENRPVVVPHGGRKAILGTNPIAMGFPAGNEPRMLFDFATAASSGVKIVNAQRSKKKIPEGWIVDKEGNPSQNADDVLEGGGQLPFGEHKGYSLLMATEWLSRVFTGSSRFSQDNRGGLYFSHSGTTMIVFRADLFQSFSDYADRADRLKQRVKSVPPAPGFEEVLIPGDPELRTRASRLQDGIPIPAKLWKELETLARSLGITISE